MRFGKEIFHAVVRPKLNRKKLLRLFEEASNIYFLSKKSKSELRKYIDEEIISIEYITKGKRKGGQQEQNRVSKEVSDFLVKEIHGIINDISTDKFVDNISKTIERLESFHFDNDVRLYKSQTDSFTSKDIKPEIVIKLRNRPGQRNLIELVQTQLDEKCSITRTSFEEISNVIEQLDYKSQKVFSFLR